MSGLNHTDGFLTKREKEIMGLVAYGESYSEISRLLSLSKETIKTHVQ